MAITRILTVNDLILQALFLINEYAPNELPTGDEIRQGCIMLNTKLDEMSGSGIYIPYTDSVTFNTSAGKSTYSFGRTPSMDVKCNKIIELMDVIVHYGDIDYPVEIVQHDIAFQRVRYPMAMTRPNMVFQQNNISGTDLLFMPTPDAQYSITIKAKLAFSNIDLQDDLSIVPPNYMRYLLFALAKDLSLIFDNTSWNDARESEYQRLESGLITTVDTDWNMNLSDTLTRRYAGWTKGAIIAG